MINDISEFCGLSTESILKNIKDLKILLSQDKKEYKDNFIQESHNLIYDVVQHNFNVDKLRIATKFNTFSPQMLSIIFESNYTSFLDLGGVGILSEVIKEMKPSIKVDFSNENKFISDFVKYRFEKYSLNINITESIHDNYDIIVSDGVLQLYDDFQQVKNINKIKNKLNNNGLFCLLVDLSGSKGNPVYNDVDILKLHSILEMDMICIYGKNTFSSVWKKII